MSSLARLKLRLTVIVAVLAAAIGIGLIPHLAASTSRLVSMRTVDTACLARSGLRITQPTARPSIDQSVAARNGKDFAGPFNRRTASEVKLAHVNEYQGSGFTAYARESSLVWVVVLAPVPAKNFTGDPSDPNLAVTEFFDRVNTHYGLEFVSATSGGEVGSYTGADCFPKDTAASP